MPISHDASKPFAQLRVFARALGWRGLDMWQHVDNSGTIITWYSTSDEKFFLQINEHPVGQTETYAAAVYADRYGICTGWHTFTLADGESADLLTPWLHRRPFKDRNWRRAFCTRHPECCIDSPTPRRCMDAKLRGAWPPHIPDDPKPPA